MKRMRRILSALWALIMVLSMAAAFSGEASAKEAGAARPKNVIFMVMDGTNSDIIALSRWYKGGPLALDGMVAGGVKTHSLESAITDSAAAATAMATGHKSVIDFIGMAASRGKDGELQVRPVATVLEAARLKGMATGIVATAPVQHATPAAFTAHSLSRHHFHEIAAQQAHQNLNLIFGGGRKWVPGTKVPGTQEVRTRKELLALQGKGPVRGYFAEEAMANELDRPVLRPEEPSLAEMSAKAIELLSGPNGFFLFIEGSKVDFAAHKNDPVGMVSELLSFDKAVEAVLDFARKDGNTMVIAVTDHGNSGMTMGSTKTDDTYAKTPANVYTAPLRKARLTLEGSLSQLKKDRSNMKEAAAQYGLDRLSSKEIKRLKRAKDPGKRMAKLMADRAHLGFTTRGHTGEDVFLYSYGPGRPTGLLDNTELAASVADFLGLEPLDDLTDRLFIPAKQWFEKQGYKTKISGTARQPVFTAKKNGDTIIYTANTNKRIRNGKPETLQGVSVFDGEEFWVPGQ